MKSILIVLLLLAGGLGGYAVYMVAIANPTTVRELHENPQGERARKVMLLALPSGKELPVNYLREDSLVFAGADGLWWRELRGEGARVEMLIRGAVLHGHARAIEDDPDYTLDVFKRLRPTSYAYLGGTLVEIRIAEP